MEAIDALPLVQTPEIFGLHSNADISYYTNATKAIWADLMDLQPRSGSAGAVRAYVTVCDRPTMCTRQARGSGVAYVGGWGEAALSRLHLAPSMTVIMCFCAHVLFVLMCSCAHVFSLCREYHARTSSLE